MFHLKSAKMTEDELLQVYSTVVHPSVEFCAASYHSMLTIGQAQRLENLQKKTLKMIYGYHLSYDQLLEQSGLMPLQGRREKKSPFFRPIVP